MAVDTQFACQNRAPMNRVVVIGSSGSGKTTTARAIANRLDLPYLELDSVYHQPGWEPLPDEEFARRVSEFSAGSRWVIDGNYTSHAMPDVVWPGADTIVWLDPPMATVMWRVISRTVRRAVTRETLWNGNKEPLTNFYSRDPNENIILWAWTRYDIVRRRYEKALDTDAWSHAGVHRLRSRRDVGKFLTSLAP